MGYRQTLSSRRTVSIPASCYLEASMVASNLSDGRRELDALVEIVGMTFIPMDEAVARLAADAFVKFGKGTGHPAQLNFGDCISYATAKHLACPLLFKGDDFRHTDVEAAI